MVGRKTAFVVCAALFSLGFGTRTLADPAYIAFDPPGSYSTEANTNCLNNGGDMVGYYFDDQIHIHGFLRTRTGHFTAVGADGDQPWAVNARKMVTGHSGHSGFVADRNGGMARFDAPGTDGTGIGTVPVAIDKQGDVVGQWGTSAQLTHGFVRDSEGNITSFDAPNAGTGLNQGTFAQAMSPQGQIAGYFIDGGGRNHGFVRAPNGKAKTIDVDGAIGIDGGTKVLSINASKTVAGLYYDQNGDHGFLIDKDGNLVKFDIPGRSTMMVTGINKHNDVVGWYVGGFVHGFVRSGTTGEVTQFDVPGAVNTVAQSINDRGEIGGYYFDSNSNTHGFLRMP